MCQLQPSTKTNVCRHFSVFSYYFPNTLNSHKINEQEMRKCSLDLEGK